MKFEDITIDDINILFDGIDWLYDKSLDEEDYFKAQRGVQVVIAIAEQLGLTTTD